MYFPCSLFCTTEKHALLENQVQEFTTVLTCYVWTMQFTAIVHRMIKSCFYMFYQISSLKEQVKSNATTERALKTIKPFAVMLFLLAFFLSKIFSSLTKLLVPPYTHMYISLYVYWRQ